MYLLPRKYGSAILNITDCRKYLPWFYQLARGLITNDWCITDDNDNHKPFFTLKSGAKNGQIKSLYVMLDFLAHLSL